MKKSICTSAVIAASFLATGCANVPITTVFGVNFSSSDFKDASVFSGSDSSDDLGFLIRGEIDPGRHERVVFDGGYQQFGDTKFDGTYMGVSDVGSIETKMITASAGYRYPFTDRFSAGGRLGAAITDVDESEIFGGTPEQHSASETVPFGGLALKYAISDKVAISANFDRYLDVGKVGETGEGDVDVFGVNVEFRFGARNRD